METFSFGGTENHSEEEKKGIGTSDSQWGLFIKNISKAFTQWTRLKF